MSDKQFEVHALTYREIRCVGIHAERGKEVHHLVIMMFRCQVKQWSEILSVGFKDLSEKGRHSVAPPGQGTHRLKSDSAKFVSRARLQEVKVSRAHSPSSRLWTPLIPQ